VVSFLYKQIGCYEEGGKARKISKYGKRTVIEK
jgi:hypothetical protein